MDATLWYPIRSEEETYGTGHTSVRFCSQLVFEILEDSFEAATIKATCGANANFVFSDFRSGESDIAVRQCYLCAELR